VIRYLEDVQKQEETGAVQGPTVWSHPIRNEGKSGKCWDENPIEPGQG
jgi:hypothetical protein